MLIIPAIDIKDSQCVRLVQGKAENKEVFSKDPCAMAKNWEEQGAKLIHIVDLDGAFQGIPVHQSMIKKIARTVNIPIQVGGGIRDEDIIKQYLNCGIQRVILGTFLLSQGTKKIQSIVRQFNNHIIAGIDVKNNRMAIEGWLQEVDQPVEKFITHLTEIGIKRIIHTDINRDGMLNGPNIDMIKKILQKSEGKIIASGGISSMDDLYQLQQLENLGLEGAIIGKALYKENIKLGEAVRIFQNKRGSTI
ncbi:MAG: 1-(5-phosphoribosyl)-5-[(5-phosphoribosylamino)methylideneamino]imidazole-4-carboxamide isomerase [Elusimicrobiota bacterium]